jgi:hypothetical protein
LKNNEDIQKYKAEILELQQSSERLKQVIRERDEVSRPPSQLVYGDFSL